MNVLFDTSVLVPALVDQLANHPICFEALLTYTSEDHSCYCSTHALAECYSVLTVLPLRRRITPKEAWQLVQESVIGRLGVVDLDSGDYDRALTLVADRGLTSGVVYDALQLVAARKAGCTCILTYNLSHFTALDAGEIVVTSP